MKKQSRIYVEDAGMENCRNPEMAAGNTDREHSIFSNKQGGCRAQMLENENSEAQRQGLRATREHCSYASLWE